MNTNKINLTKTTAYNEQLLSSIRRERNNLQGVANRRGDSLNIYIAYSIQIDNIQHYLKYAFTSPNMVWTFYRITFKDYDFLLAVPLLTGSDLITSAEHREYERIESISKGFIHEKRIAKANRQWANPDRNKTQGLANRDILNAVFASITDRIKKAGLGHLLFKGHSFGWTEK